MQTPHFSEITFVVHAHPKGGYVATSEEHEITVKAAELAGIRDAVREAVAGYFHESDPARPRTIVLKHVHEERFAA